MNKYLSILYKKEDMPETDLKESNVIPNLINSVNKNDQRILDEVNKNAEQIGDIENTLQNKMNQIETNRHNINVLSGSITGIRDTVQSYNLRTLGGLQNQLISANNTKIGEAVSNLKSAWDEANETAMSNIKVNIDQKKDKIQTEIFNLVSSNVENSFVSNSNFGGFSNYVYDSIGDLRYSTSSNTSRITSLEQSSSGYVSANDFATFSNNAITKSNLSTHLPSHLSEQNLNSKYLQTSAINSSMSNYLTLNNYLTSSRLTGYATTSNLETLSDSLSSYLHKDDADNTMSNYLNDHNYLTTDSTLTGYATTSNLETLSNSLSNYLHKDDANTAMSNYLSSNNYLTTDSTLTGYATTSNLETLSNSLSNYLKTEDADTAMSTYLNSNNYINSNNINQYTSSFVSQTDFESLSNSLSNVMRTNDHATTSHDSGDSDITTSNTTRIGALESNVESLSNDMITDATFDSESNMLMLQQNNGSNISVDLSDLASATAASEGDTVGDTAPFTESDLTLSLDSTNGLCVKYGGSYSNCISISNIQQEIYTKTEYPTETSTTP